MITGHLQHVSPSPVHLPTWHHRTSNVPLLGRHITPLKQQCFQRNALSTVSRQRHRYQRVLAALPGASGDLKAGDILGKKYKVQEVLGRGANAVTYKCLDQSSGAEVAVKALSLRNLRDWKQLELFEREAQVLKSLDHPGIPRYLEYFEEDTAEDRGFFLVQELGEGRSLAELVGRGWRADEAEVARIAGELLKILDYLGSRRPAVIHRDVKPENIVLEGGKAGGRVLLVDFGGVQGAAAVGDRLGSTIVGTYGYMAPEQFRGGAQPASDLYGLGGTLLYLLSGQPPSSFPQDRLRLNFDKVSMSPRLRLLLEGLLDPLVEDRMTAQQAQRVLRGEDRGAETRGDRASRGSRGGSLGGTRWGEQQRQRQQQQYLQRQQYPGRYMEPYPEVVPPQPYRAGVRRGKVRKPAGSRVRVEQKGPSLEIEIPPAGLTGSSVSTGAFALVWNAFVAFWTVGALAGGGVLFALFSIPFWLAGAQLAKASVAGAFLRERVLIGLNSWRVQQQLGLARGDGGVSWDEEGGLGKKEAKGRCRDLQGASVNVSGYVNGVPQTQLVIKEGVNSYIVGEGLELAEQEWLAQVINDHIQQNKQLSSELEAFPEALDDPVAAPLLEDSLERRFRKLEGGEGAGNAPEPASRKAATASRAPFQRSRGGDTADGGSRTGENADDGVGLSYAEFVGRQARDAGARAAAEAEAAGRRARGEAERAARRAAEEGDRAAKRGGQLGGGE